MESQALQELVRKIFSDEGVRSQFQANPESVLSKFSLTDCEKTAVLNAQAKFGLNANATQLEAIIGPNSFWV
jgi:hypothetical protein